MKISEQVREELRMMESYTSGSNFTSSQAYWECTNCDIKYKPTLLPPKCPNCGKLPELDDAVEI